MQGAAGSKASARGVKANAAAVEAGTKLNIASDVTQLIGEHAAVAPLECQAVHERQARWLAMNLHTCMNSVEAHVHTIAESSC